jgi:hypothetical protein
MIVDFGNVVPVGNYAKGFCHTQRNRAATNLAQKSLCNHLRENSRVEVLLRLFICKKGDCYAF